MDVAPNQIVSVAASLIPFLEHDDANRALMGSNMQRQAVPLLRLRLQSLEQVWKAGCYRFTALIIAEGDGVVEYVDANKIVIRYDLTEETILVSFDAELETYNLIKFRRTNQDTCINLKPIVKKGAES